MWNYSNNTLHVTESIGKSPPPSSTLNEGDIAGLLIGCVFLAFLVVPVALSYILVYCYRFHVFWKSRQEQCDSSGLEDVVECDLNTVQGVTQEEPLPNAELTQSQAPPSYTMAVNEELSQDTLMPPDYNCALNMEKV